MCYHWDRGSTWDSFELLGVVCVARAGISGRVSCAVLLFRGVACRKRRRSHTSSESWNQDGRTHGRGAVSVQWHRGTSVPKAATECLTKPRPWSVSLTVFRFVVVSRVWVTPCAVDILHIGRAIGHCRVSRAEVNDGFRGVLCKCDFRDCSAARAVRVVSISCAVA